MKKSAPIPSRRRLSGLTADDVATIMFDTLVSSWGLTNSGKIVTVLARKLRAEKKRRKETP